VIPAEPWRVWIVRKHYKPEEIVAKLRQVEMLLAQGESAVEATSST